MRVFWYSQINSRKPNFWPIQESLSYLQVVSFLHIAFRANIDSAWIANIDTVCSWTKVDLTWAMIANGLVGLSTKFIIVVCDLHFMSHWTFEWVSSDDFWWLSSFAFIPDDLIWWLYFKTYIYSIIHVAFLRAVLTDVIFTFAAMVKPLFSYLLQTQLLLALPTIRQVFFWFRQICKNITEESIHLMILLTKYSIRSSLFSWPVAS